MSKKLGNLIKEARTKKGMTQAELASAVDGLSAATLGKMERGETEAEEAVVRSIAKVLGVTQTSLVEAMSRKGSSAKSGSAKTGTAKTSSKTASAGKTSESRKTTAKKTTAKKTDAGIKLTQEEKRLLDLYRKADSGVKNAVMLLLKGEDQKSEDLMGSLIGTAISAITGKL